MYWEPSTVSHKVMSDVIGGTNMLKDLFVLKSVSDMVRKAADQTLSDLSEGWVEQEAAFTDRLIANLQNKIDGKTIKGIRWKAKTLTDRGPGAQESVYGADFLGVLDMDLQDFQVKKGFVAQAKLLPRKRKHASSAEFERLQKQCRKMLAITPDAFVFLYNAHSIKIVPALSVLGTKTDRIRHLASQSIGRFFREYLECFIGDQVLSAPSLERFEEIAGKYHIQKGLYLHASDEEDLLEKQPVRISTHARTHTGQRRSDHVQRQRLQR